MLQIIFSCPIINFWISDANQQSQIPSLGTTGVCIHLFSKIFNFLKKSFSGVFGVADHEFDFILPLEASVPRYTTKMSTFWKYWFMSFFEILVFSINWLNMGLRDPGLLEFPRLVDTEELATEFALNMASFFRTKRSITIWSEL